MAGSDSNFQVVYRGENLTDYALGGLVFFQRPKENGGGFWLGRTYDRVFWFEISAPVSLSQGLLYLQAMNNPLQVDREYTSLDNNLSLF
ncbi:MULTISPECIES: hypothetical protein [unclassified Pantoea]|uniref:hypothetical protein n=1 Tax=unclassified Pantoea TaxID=2630326 RepID=UPI0024777B2A|nr:MULTISPECIES: hypothetical protein [unclassified Pantoea]GME39246.1 hypothetical protein ACJ3_22770 [Pantoea sp. QMID3]GME41105.1 hypothetical protein ACJ1_26900 [Pantoea sp. QMID1]GME54009.1 hypothetical protein ACJ4_14750 [Pantoea sp. QMID4]GME55052.1 hypothetical protein ACJ2_14770 [Pantoea sp. QMID2]